MREDDWRPKVTRIDDPIADDYWEYVTFGGERRISRLMVGRPVPWPKARAWFSPVMIEGHTDPTVMPIFGSGPVDSLMNAMTFVKRFFEENSMVVPCAKPPSARKKRSRTALARRQPAAPGSGERRTPSREPRKPVRKPRAR
jgi:hypothetical protein